MTMNPRYKRRFWPRVSAAIWCLTNKTLFRWSPFFMDGWRVFILRAFGANIARGVRIKRTVLIKRPSNLTVSDNAMICDGVHLYCEAPITIGRRAQIGEETWLMTGAHNVHSKSFAFTCGPIKIGDDAWIATKALILQNVEIATGAVVAAGSVVPRSVLPWTIVAGNPVKMIGQRDLTGE